MVASPAVMIVVVQVVATVVVTTGSESCPGISSTDLGEVRVEHQHDNKLFILHRHGGFWGSQSFKLHHDNKLFILHRPGEVRVKHHQNNKLFILHRLEGR